jgi:hypothetical protein
MKAIYQIGVLVLILLVGDCYVQGEEMKETYEFTAVNAFAEDTAGRVVSFDTDAGKRVRIKYEEPGSPVIRFLRRAVADRKAVFVAYDSVTGLCRYAVPFIEDRVLSVEAGRESPSVLEVVLLRRPSSLFLSSTNPRFPELRTILENVKGKDQMVWIGTFPGDSNILDVCLPTAKGAGPRDAR